MCDSGSTEMRQVGGLPVWSICVAYTLFGTLVNYQVIMREEVGADATLIQFRIAYDTHVLTTGVRCERVCVCRIRQIQDMRYTITCPLIVGWASRAA